MLELEAHSRAPPPKVQLAWAMEVSGVQPLVGLPVVSRRVVLVLLKIKSLERDRRMSGFWGGMAGSKEWEKVLCVVPSTAEFHCQ